MRKVSLVISATLGRTKEAKYPPRGGLRRLVSYTCDGLRDYRSALKGSGSAWRIVAAWGRRGTGVKGHEGRFKGDIVGGVEHVERVQRTGRGASFPAVAYSDCLRPTV